MKPDSSYEMRPKRWLFVSLLLVLGAYSSFSWFLFSITAPRLVWVAVIAFSLLEALLLTALSKGLRRFIKKWLRSDLGYFSVVIVAAFSITVALVWYNVFEYFVLVAGSEVLARLDLQNAGFSPWQAFFVLTFVTLVGLAVGWSAYEFTDIASTIQTHWA